jgi:hypothetical protein
MIGRKNMRRGEHERKRVSPKESIEREREREGERGGA